MLFGKNITKSFGSQRLFDGADFQLNTGERIAMVGRNGSGKSTLFSLLTGKDIPDEGEIVIPKNYRLGVLDQHLHFEKTTIREEVCQSLGPDDQHNVWKGEKLLSGLGFSPADFDRPACNFSGGFQIRIKLAQLLLSDPDLLLLDEPTNYLDIITIRWIESFLQSWKKEVICISHDQMFLEAFCTHTLMLHRQQFKKIKGAPAKAYAQIEQEETLHERTRVNQQREAQKSEKFIREFRSGARSAGLVQSRIKMLEKKEKIEALPFIPPIEFHFTPADFTGAKLLEGHNLSFRYEGGQDLFRKLSFQVLPGEKIGIIGANGKGKSTLLQMLHRDLSPTSGTLKIHPNTHVGYLGQSHIDRLDASKTILQELQSVAHTSEQNARSVAGSLLFSGNLAQKPIKVLSGGEKSRVNLGKVLLSPVNLLLLDEPTNHLDYESVEAFIHAVKSFEGAAILVSHNEAFLRAVCQKLIVFDGDEVFFYPHDYDTFLSEKGFASECEAIMAPQELVEKRQQKPVHRESEKERQRLMKPLKRVLERVEKEILKLEQAQKDNVEAFKVADRQGNRLKMEQLGIVYQDLHKKLEVQWQEWNQVAEQIAEVESRNGTLES